MKITWQTVALVVALAVIVLWVMGCVSRTSPPPELVEDLKLSPAVAKEGVTAPELDALFQRWTAKKEAERKEKAEAAEKAAADAKVEADARAAEAAAKVDDLKAEAQLTLDGLDAEYRAKVARAQVDLSKQVRQAGSDAQAAILSITRQADAVGSAFKAWARQQSDRAAAVAAGVASGKADLERQDYLKQAAAQLGLQAATPWLPAGALSLATLAIGGIFGRRQGQTQGEEPARALLSAAKAAGVLPQIGQHINDHAEPDDAAALARIGMKDNVTLPVPARPTAA